MFHMEKSKTFTASLRNGFYRCCLGDESTPRRIRFYKIAIPIKFPTFAFLWYCVFRPAPHFGPNYLNIDLYTINNK